MMEILHFLEESLHDVDCIYSESNRSIDSFSKILSARGSLWLRVSDEDMSYLKINCDSVFGRENFITHIILETQPSIDIFSRNHAFLLVYAKDKSIWRPNLLPRTKRMDRRYKNPDNDPRGAWIASDLSVRTYNPTCDYTIRGVNGKIFQPPAGRSWSVNREVYEHLLADNRIWFGKSGNARPMRKRFLSEVRNGHVSKTIWTADENPLEKILQLAANQNSTVLVL